MKSLLKCSVFLYLVILSNHLFGQQEDIRVHDPVMIKEGDTYFVFCTGRGISFYTSPDMKSWSDPQRVFQQIPEWTSRVVPGFRGHMWAPDIHYFDGRYYLYYSVSAFGVNTSAIGLVTNVTLDPESPDYEWKDQGMIVQSIPHKDMWNAIDPNIIEDEDGYPWMSFGSFWSGIKLVRLTPNRLALAQPEEWYSVAKREFNALGDDSHGMGAAIEAPFIFQKDTMYYLFVSWDYCCKGEESTYKVVVGRSDKVNGPYLDKEGIRMDKGGGSLVVEGNSNWAGAGHNSAYTFDGKDYLVFHAYDMNDHGISKLKIAPISWDKDGWPTIPNILK